MRHRPSLVLRLGALRIMIGRVADDMIKAAGENRWQFTNVGGQYTHPVGKAVGGGVFLGNCGKIAMLFHSRDLNFAQPMRHT